MWVNSTENSDEHKNKQATLHVKTATEEIPKLFLFISFAEIVATCHSL
jgi:hypothetical protein